MRGTALLDQLVELAQKQGLAIRREPMSRGAGTGGLCVLKGAPTVFVDERASVDTQIEVLSGVLRRFDWSGVFVPPSVRKLLGATGEGDALESAG
jgi:hypothetical protein